MILGIVRLKVNYVSAFFLPDSSFLSSSFWIGIEILDDVLCYIICSLCRQTFAHCAFAVLVFTSSPPGCSLLCCRAWDWRSFQAASLCRTNLQIAATEPPRANTRKHPIWMSLFSFLCFRNVPGLFLKKFSTRNPDFGSAAHRVSFRY